MEVTKKPKKISVVKIRRAYWYKLSILRAVIRVEALKLLSSNFLMLKRDTNSGLAYTITSILSVLSNHILDNSKLNCNDCPTRLQCHLNNAGTPERLSLNLPLYEIHSKKVYNHYDNCMSQQRAQGSSNRRNPYWGKQWDISSYHKTITELEEEYKEYFDMSEQDIKDKLQNQSGGWKLTI